MKYYISGDMLINFSTEKIDMVCIAVQLPSYIQLVGLGKKKIETDEDSDKQAA